MDAYRIDLAATLRRVVGYLRVGGPQGALDAKLDAENALRLLERGASVSPPPSSPPSKEAVDAMMEWVRSDSLDWEALERTSCNPSSSPAPSAEGNSEAAEEWERAEMWRRKANDLHARVSELEADVNANTEGWNALTVERDEARRRVSELENAAREVVKRAFQSAVFPTSMIVDRTLLDALHALLPDTEGAEPS